MTFYTLRVINIIKETEDTITLCFKQPGLKKLKYSAGQYLTLVFRINGRRYVRPYSFSSAPGVDSLLEVTIKRVHGGLISNHVNDEVKIGDSIEAMEAMGDFTYNVNHASATDNIFLWGAGSGITPLISITKHILATDSSKKVTLVYGNRNHETVIFNEKIKQLQASFPSAFTAWHFHTRLVIDNQNPYLVQGRIDTKKALSILENADVSNSLHYICGPLGLKESVKNALQSKGIPDDHIKTEDFELIRDPKDFENIQTRFVNLHFEGQTTILEVVKGKSILEAGLDALLELPYSCQTGNCITCKGKLIAGAVKMIGINKLPDGLGKGEYLLCCSHPLTDNVQISIQ